MSVRPREEEEELRRRGDQSDFWHLRRKAEEGPKSPPLFSFSRPTASISLPLLSPTRSLRLVSKTCLPQGIIPLPWRQRGRGRRRDEGEELIECLEVKAALLLLPSVLRCGERERFSNVEILHAPPFPLR